MRKSKFYLRRNLIYTAIGDQATFTTPEYLIGQGKHISYHGTSNEVKYLTIGQLYAIDKK
jgi:hypothetical protein